MIGLKCEICNHREKLNLKDHLESVHNLSTKSYKKLYPNSKTMTGHSKRTLEYWVYRGCTESQALEEVRRYQKGHKELFLQRHQDRGFSREEAQQLWNYEQATRSPRSKLKYLAKGYTEAEAVEAVRRVQSKYSALSSKFKGHTHRESTKQQISKAMKEHAQEVGHGTLAQRFKEGAQGLQSRGEINCYRELKQIFPKIVGNKTISPYTVDMYLDGIVIEYYGDFWHRNPELYEKTYVQYGKSSEEVWLQDSRRVAQLEQNYTVFVIWESDWKFNKDSVIENLKKLYESKQNYKA